MEGRLDSAPMPNQTIGSRDEPPLDTGGIGELRAIRWLVSDDLRQKIAQLLLDFRCDQSVHPRGGNRAASQG